MCNLKKYKIYEKIFLKNKFLRSLWTTPEERTAGVANYGIIGAHKVDLIKLKTQGNESYKLYGYLYGYM